MPHGWCRSVFLALSRDQFTLRAHGYGASASREGSALLWPSYHWYLLHLPKEEWAG